MLTLLSWKMKLRHFKFFRELIFSPRKRWCLSLRFLLHVSKREREREKRLLQIHLGFWQPFRHLPHLNFKVRGSLNFPHRTESLPLITCMHRCVNRKHGCYMHIIVLFQTIIDSLSNIPVCQCSFPSVFPFVEKWTTTQAAFTESCFVPVNKPAPVSLWYLFCHLTSTKNRRWSASTIPRIYCLVDQRVLLLLPWRLYLQLQKSGRTDDGSPSTGIGRRISPTVRSVSLYSEKKTT